MDFDGDSAEALPQMEFLFLGGNLALDLVNTKRSRRLPGSRVITQYDQLYDRDQAAAWWREAAGRYRHECHEDCGWSEEAFELLIALRIELRAVFEALGEGRNAACPTPVLNKVLSMGSFSMRIDEGGSRREYLPREGGSSALLAIALAASRLLAKGDLSRLRACRSERCTMLFYDTTKSGTRHWCHSECMNRARARANYKKTKGEG
jgi:predicted RNA-binding Zn ribbon-like protein